MNKEETLQLRVEPSLKRELQKMADADNRKLADYVRLQLIKLVEENKKKK
jgi:predicted HicB family RNase H-like nuclease